MSQMQIHQKMLSQSQKLLPVRDNLLMFGLSISVEVRSFLQLFHHWALLLASRLGKHLVDYCSQLYSGV